MSWSTIEENFHIIKGVYEKPMANIIFNGEWFKVFSLKIRNKTGCLCFLLLLNIILEGFVGAIWLEK